MGGSTSVAAAEKSGNTAFLAEMNKRPEDQRIKTHNRWHPDIPFVQWFKPGDEFRVEC
ncbi:MAG: acetamidase/formamidase family protein, partial [Gammaproteobacteria bacterium]|nr:acetamidase/formamidase family protein [Gammaproteobacteria bacterium]